MEAVELEPDWDANPPRARARRGIALISASVITITAAGIGFLHPTFPATATPVPLLHAAYRVVAADFIDHDRGWLVALLPSGDYAVMHTDDGALSWTRQLSVPGDGHSVFLKFFDRSVGVFALVGTRPVLHRTSDGGLTWSAVPALSPTSTVVSWSFVDSEHGWMLAYDGGVTRSAAERLYRTEDKGRSWTDLGVPVGAPDQAFQVHFSYLTTGWLTTSGAGAYAYKTNDFGATWSRVALPAPAGGWPRSGEFFVAVQPTLGGGAVASVVYFSPIKGRSDVGGIVRDFPPLTVRVFDGGRPHIYTYATGIDQLVGGPFGQDQAPNQVEFSTVNNGATWRVIEPPSPDGAIGYFDASNWWWIGSGLWSNSKDGGVTWMDMRGVGVVDPVPGSLRVQDRDHAWFAGSAGWRPLLEGTDDGGQTWRMVMLPPI